MKHKLHYTLTCTLLMFSLCLNNLMANENKPGQAPPPPPREHRIPLGQQFDVRARITALLENLRQNDPEEYQRLIKLRAENREKYLQELWEKLPERENDNREKIAETDRQCRELGKKFQQAGNEEEKEAIKAQLSTLLEQSMELVINDTKERLERVQGMLDHLNTNREKIMQQRLEQFLSGQAPMPPPEKNIRHMNRPRKRQKQSKQQ